MKSERIWNSRFIHLVCLESCLQLGLYMQNPIVSNYAVFLGASISLAGFLVGMNAMSSLVFRPISGLASDLIRKKNLLVMSAALYVFASFGCALSDSVALIGLFRIMQGFAFAFRSVASMSMVSYVVSPSVLGSAMGWFGSAYTITSAIGPGIGVWIGSIAGYPMTFVTAGIFQFLGLLLAICFKGSPPVEKQNLPQNLEERSKKISLQHLVSQLRPSKLFNTSVLPLSVVAGLSSVAYGSIAAFILMIGEMRGVEGAYLYFTVYTFVTVIAKPLAGRVNDRYGIKSVIVPTLLLAASGMVILAFSTTLLSILIGAICMGCGQGAAYSMLQAESVRKARKEEVGRAANTFFIGPDIGMWIGPVISGAILQMFGITVMFLFIAVALIIGLAVFLISRRSHRDEVPR